MKNRLHLWEWSRALLLLWLFAAATAPAQNAGTNTNSSNFSIVVTQSNFSSFGAFRSFGAGPSGPSIFSDYVLHRGEIQPGDAVVIRGNSTIDGDVGGDSVTMLGNATINGKVAGNVVVILGSLNLGPTAEIGGDAVVILGQLNRAPGAKIDRGDATVLFSNIPGLNGLGRWLSEGLLRGRLLPPGVGWVWVVAAVCLGINLLLLLLFPRPLQACVRTIEEKPLISLFAGVLAKMLAGLLTLLLILTMFGAFLLPFLALANLVAVMFGKITTYRYVGQQLGRLCRIGFLQNPAASLILGTAVFYFLYTVPFLSFAAWGFAGIFGLGAVVLTVFDYVRAGRAKPPVPMALGAAPPVTAENPSAAFSGVPPVVPVPPSTAASLPPPIAPSAMEQAALPRAGFWIRFFATALDGVLFLIVFGLFAHSRILDRASLGLIHGDFCTLWWLLYHVYFWRWKGTTVGGIIMGIKVIRLDGRPLDFPVALIRALASVLSFFVLGLGFFWAAISPDKQSWHDRIAGTVIVKVPPGLAMV